MAAVSVVASAVGLAEEVVLAVASALVEAVAALLVAASEVLEDSEAEASAAVLVSEV